MATAQFPVSADVERNRRRVMDLMRAARARGAHVVHFPEAALSGYAGVDIPNHDRMDWAGLQLAIESILDLAGALRLWTILGSAHPLAGRRKPHNSLYVIDDRGRLVDRYDKCFCAGDRAGRTGDLAHYTPGDRLTVFTIRGVRCGALICHDYRYPELYRAYKRQRVELMFHAFHAGHVPTTRLRDMERGVGRANRRFNPGSTLPEITMPASMIAAASQNYMWISATNSSARWSCWPAFAVRPDGVIVGRQRRHVAGVLLTRVDTRQRWYDSTVAWRDRAMEGVLHSGRPVRDRRANSTPRRRSQP